MDTKRPILDSVVAILKYQNEIIINKRHLKLKAFPGYISFPGGKVDDEDRSNQDQNLIKLFQNKFSTVQSQEESLENFNITCIDREIFEELNVSIKELLKENKIDSIYNVLLAISPSVNPHRFKTNFILFELNTKIEIPNKNEESEYIKWVEIKKFVDEDRRGDHLIVPPVRNAIYKISENNYNFSSFDEDKEFKNGVIEASFINDFKIAFIPSNTLPPFHTTNAFILGEGEDKFIVDPSPKDEKTYNDVIDILKREKIKKIFITHHHGDHFEKADLISKELKIPMLMHKITFDFIQAQYKTFDPYKVIFIDEFSRLGTWQNEELKIMHVPGHAQGQLAIYPKSKKWFIASDLFQGVGSVVIGMNGSMIDYFKSLHKVISLNPDCVIPSHGVPLGGVGIIEKNLKHREFREKQILHCLNSENNAKEMIDQIYFGVDPKLLDFAVTNLFKHIEKIQIEKLYEFKNETYKEDLFKDLHSYIG